MTKSFDVVDCYSNHICIRHFGSLRRLQDVKRNYSKTASRIGKKEI